MEKILENIIKDIDEFLIDNERIDIVYYNIIKKN